MDEGAKRTSPDQSGTDPYCERGWDEGRRDYACRDGEVVAVPRRSPEVGGVNKAKTLPANTVYYIPRKEPRITVSGVAYDRCTTELFGAPKGVRTIIFPSTVRAVYPGSFSWQK